MRGLHRLIIMLYAVSLFIKWSISASLKHREACVNAAARFLSKAGFP